ncbi:hypothetical protein [Dyella mobilis]|uniref:Uncharacterized protein n=1 Tax=Dyella mobilis TaxID=1849582 RepID=A0ABS2KKF7_9GAMM|nr:hypothetical protein [Dyella mobilis]MBM7131389.1 hypothetical protein [Dyella mobilis]GLQ96639.1 hypothetical protein GCM10007863_10570 [Dyella mobilis]
MPLHLYHYTTKESYEKIIQSMMLIPSTQEGKEHTHFGKGIYFGSLDPFFDAQYLGLEELGGNLFTQVSKGNFEKFFYFVEVRFPDDFDPMPQSVLVKDDKKAGFTYENQFLYLLKTEKPLILAKENPAHGQALLFDHGITYWGQLRALRMTDKDIRNEPPAWQRKPRQ